MCQIIFNVTIFTFLFFLNIMVISKYCAAEQNRSNYRLKIEPDMIIFPNEEERNHQQFQHHEHSPYFHSFQHHHHHHHHHNHHPEFHNMDNDNNESNNEDNFDEINYNSTSVPLELIMRLNSYTDVNDLLLNLVEGNMEEDTILESRFGEGERSAAIVPKAAGCIPELQTVRITSDDDPSILYIPACTRIERCGGCCSHSLLACQQKDFEMVGLQVVKTQFVGGSKLKFVGKEIVHVEKHTKCKCDCRVQEKDCNSFQEYRKSECRCACTNTDEEKKCYKENATKLWDPEICACQCRNVLMCSTGYMFDPIRCRCTSGLVKRRFAELGTFDKIIKSEIQENEQNDNVKT